MSDRGASWLPSDLLMSMCVQPTQTVLVGCVWVLNQVVAIVLYCILCGSKVTQPVCPMGCSLCVYVVCILFFWTVAHWQETDQRGVHWLSKCWQELCHKHTALQESLQCGPHCRWNKGMSGSRGSYLLWLILLPWRVIIQDMEMSICFSWMKITIGSLASI